MGLRKKWGKMETKSSEQSKTKHDRKNLDEVLKYKKISSPKGSNRFRTLYVTTAAFPPLT